MFMCLDTVQQLSQRCLSSSKWVLLLQELLQALRRYIVNSSILYLRYEVFYSLLKQEGFF